MSKSLFGWIAPIAAVLLSASAPIPLTADDWPQWLGPNRDGDWRESGLIDKFPEKGLTAKWRAPVNLGYSGPAVVDGRVYLTDYERQSGDTANDPETRRALQGQERVLCLDADSGKPIWEHKYACQYNISYPAGPRATPTVHDGKVYSLGAEGNLLCLDARIGDVIWSKDFQNDYKTKAPIWGFCGAPLVYGKSLICLVGGEGSIVVAFDKDTGKELWKGLSAPEPGYCPPSIIEAGGTRQLIIWHVESINSLNPDNGYLYWSIPLKPDYGMSIMIPQKHGDYIYAGGIGNVGALLKLDSQKPAAEVVWRGKNDNSVYPANATPVIDESGIMYGADCRGGQLRGVELKTGRRLWETFAATTGDRRASHATAYIIKNGKRYVIFGEKGDLIFANLTEKGYDEISRTHVIDPTEECFGREVAWAHPAFANKSVYVRNDKELVCYPLAAK